MVNKWSKGGLRADQFQEKCQKEENPGKGVVATKSNAYPGES